MLKRLVPRLQSERIHEICCLKAATRAQNTRYGLEMAMFGWMWVSNLVPKVFLLLTQREGVCVHGGEGESGTLGFSFCKNHAACCKYHHQFQTLATYNQQIRF